MRFTNTNNKYYAQFDELEIFALWAILRRANHDFDYYRVMREYSTLDLNDEALDYLSGFLCTFEEALYEHLPQLMTMTEMEMTANAVRNFQQ